MIDRKVRLLIEKKLFQGKIIQVTGPRQVGKTTLVESLVHASGLDAIFLNGDESDVRQILTNTTSAALRNLVGNKKLVVIDEAQRIENIGITLKLFADHLKNIQVIATGSSSFDLSNRINEPLTGRKFEFNLYPLSFEEMADHTSVLDERRLIEQRMIFGYYPEVVLKSEEASQHLKLISSSYLYKDLFDWRQIKKPALLENILQALALQLGNEVSYLELAQLTGSDNETVERYIDLLEKSFVVFRLNSLSRNLRNELKKSRKIYFWDNGIRNAIIKNFNPLSLRQDTGALWENFMIVERIKFLSNRELAVNKWFWRTHAGQEIDYIEEVAGEMQAFELKWNTKKNHRIPKTFLANYDNASATVVHPNNFTDFIYQR